MENLPKWYIIIKLLKTRFYGNAWLAQSVDCVTPDLQGCKFELRAGCRDDLQI